GRVEAGDKAKERGLAAAAGPDQRNQFSCGGGEADPGQSDRADIGVARRRKILLNAYDAERGTFNCGIARGHGYHLMVPFCQTSTRSRVLNSRVMMVEKNAAMITRAA